MKVIKMTIRSVGVLGIVLLAIACSGGGGTSGTDENPGGSENSTIDSFAIGTIEGFGSIIVDGMEFETDGAEVEIEDEDAFDCSPSGTDDCGLRIGMVVALMNAFDDTGNPATVTKILYEDNIEGPISAFATDASGLVKTLTVLGHTVAIQKGITRFDDSDPDFDDFDDLNDSIVNNLVEVSGTVNSDGSIMATYIERKAQAVIPGDRFEVKGNVANLSPALRTFEINGLTVDFTGVVPRNGTLDNGVLVEVKGDNFDGTTLFATDLEIRTAGFGLNDVAKVHVEGYVINLNAIAQTFWLNDQLVEYVSAEFTGGIESDLINGVKVEAEGPIVNGVLLAVKIKFKDSVRLEANLQNVNTGAGTLTLQGLSGITVRADGLTSFDGFVTLGDLAAGNNLKIRGRRLAPAENTVIASRIELIDTNSDNRTIIIGHVDSFISFSSVTILGVAIDTTTIEDNDFKDEDTPIGESVFFDRLNAGDLVKARFDIDEDRWDQIEFQD